MATNMNSGVYDVLRGGLVLIVNRDEKSAEWIAQAAAALGLEAERAWDTETALNVLRLVPGMVVGIFVDVGMPDGEGQKILQSIRGYDRRAPIVAMGSSSLFDHRIPLAVLPSPLEHKSIAIALQLVASMRARRIAEATRRAAMARRAAA